MSSCFGVSNTSSILLSVYDSFAKKTSTNTPSQAASCIDVSSGLIGSLDISGSEFSFNGLDCMLVTCGAPVAVGCTIGSSSNFSISVSDTSFQHNLGLAGALHVSGASALSLLNVTSRFNQGGAMLIEAVDDVIIDACHFDGNHVDGRPWGSSISAGGGALSLLACGSINIHGSSFQDVSSLGSGGAIYVDSTADLHVQFIYLQIISCSFQNCSSLSSNGGALSVMNRDYTVISSVNFTACSAANSGGAVYTTSGSVDVDHSTFVSCAAGVLPDSGWPTSAFAGTSFDSQRLYTSGGGGMYLDAVNFVSNKNVNNKKAI